MAEARQREAWGHTSVLLAMAANLGRMLAGRKGGKTFKPSDFDPFAGPPPPEVPPPPEASPEASPEALPGNVRLLKDVFVDNKPLEHLEGLHS
ncbi:MAG: hypothetical protein IT440_05455 [Phycisphaeraceae bacterium]|nr:hypothetical protein [Phycisphaeraceae bacterium]